MIYKVLHKLFGWDYVHWTNTVDRGIARVHVDYTNRVWYWRYRSTKLIDEIKAPNQVLWLTCEPSKYFKKLENEHK